MAQFVNQITVKVTTEEHEKITAAAKANKQTVGAYIRDLVNRADQLEQLCRDMRGTCTNFCPGAANYRRMRDYEQRMNELGLLGE